MNKRAFGLYEIPTVNRRKRDYLQWFSYSRAIEGLVYSARRGFLCIVGRIFSFGYTSLSLVQPDHDIREQREGVYEAHLPSEPAQAGKDPRFSQAYEHGRGT